MRANEYEMFNLFNTLNSILEEFDPPANNGVRRSAYITQQLDEIARENPETIEALVKLGTRGVAIGEVKEEIFGSSTPFYLLTLPLDLPLRIGRYYDSQKFSAVAMVVEYGVVGAVAGVVHPGLLLGWTLWCFGGLGAALASASYIDTHYSDAKKTSQRTFKLFEEKGIDQKDFMEACNHYIKRSRSPS